MFLHFLNVMRQCGWGLPFFRRPKSLSTAGKFRNRQNLTPGYNLWKKKYGAGANRLAHKVTKRNNAKADEKNTATELN